MKFVVEFFDGSYLAFLKPFVHRTLYMSKARQYDTAYGANQALVEARKSVEFRGAQVAELKESL